MPFTVRRVGEAEKRQRRKLLLIKSLRWSLLLGAPLLRWYGDWKRQRQADKALGTRVSILKRIIVGLITVLLIVVVLSGVVKALVATKVVSVNTVFNVAGKELPVDENGFTNILLLGRGDEDHDGVDLTDSMMLVSLDPKNTKSIVMVSLPRDLFVLQPKLMRRSRINELYRDEKAKVKREQKLPESEASAQALKTLTEEMSTLLGVQIHHAAMVDFTGFTKVVDAIGGVDVEVPEDIVDTEYPGPNYTYQTFEVKAGPQHLDGETALKYARSRHTSSDFGRSARQQQILSALGEKAKGMGIGSAGTLKKLWDIAAEHTETTMTFGEILGAAQLGENIDRSRLITVQLNNQNGLYDAPVAVGGFLYNPPRDQFDGASVLLPVSIPEFPVTWKQIRTFMTLLLQHRGIYLSSPQLSVLNAGAKPGTGRALGNELMRYNLTPSIITNMANKEKREKSEVLALHEDDKALATFFATLLRLPVRVATEDEVLGEDMSLVTIILGKDYQYQPLQDLLPTSP